MWVLQGSEATAGKVHYLVCGQTLKVGRRDSHILLSNDVSISRSHATFTLTHQRANMESKEAAKVELKDLKSKYGTFINDSIQKDQRLSPDVPHELRHGDLVRFGIFTNTWRLEHQALIVTTSTLKNKDRQQLIDALLTLGGHLQNDWSSDCCYLVMPAITFTVKVACALAAGRNIVLPEFFTKLADAIINQTPHPSPAEYLPPVMELRVKSAGASFSPDSRRATVFAGLTFLFSTQVQMARMCKPVHLAGGKVELLAEDNFAEVVSGKYLLISSATDSQQSDTLYSKTCGVVYVLIYALQILKFWNYWYPTQYAYPLLFCKANLYSSDLLKQHGLRTVGEGEIGLAILFISTEGHCNASFKHSDIFKRSSSTSQASEKLKIFATETQATECSVSLTGSKVVPESGVPQPSTSAQDEKPLPRKPPKRPLVTNDSVGGKAKRINRPPSPDLTQPLSTLELCDEDNENSDKMEVTMAKFKPEHTNTQRNDHPSSATQDPSATVSFAPYTLPSLKTLEPEEEEEKTQPFHPDRPEDEILSEGDMGIKVKEEEPRVDTSQRNDLKFDEWWKEEDSGRKRVRGEETSPQHQESKKIKTNCTDNEHSVINRNSQDDHNGGSNKRKIPESDESIFALPPRARHRERTVESLTCKPSADSDLFTLPARIPRARRVPSVPDCTSVPPSLPAVSQDSPALPPTAESSAVVTSKKEEFVYSKFIDREEASTIKNSDSSGELTASRTVVVVEPMVKPLIAPCKPSLSASDDSSCLSNFKVFKKVNATCILKVIGGSDFVENDQTAASQEFKIDLHVIKKNRPLQERNPSFDEELFNLGGPTRKRR